MSNIYDVTKAGRSYEEYVEQQRKAKNTVDQDMFLRLLVTQLQYQNPLEPMSDQEFVAQLAQFSSLEAITDLKSSMSMYQSYGLAGKYVYGEYKNNVGEKVEVFGIVDRVLNVNGVAYVEVSGQLFEASKVTEVYDSALFEYDNSALLDKSNLIGRNVVAKVADGADEDGNPIYKEIGGKVTRIGLEGSVVYAYLDSADEESGETVKVNVRSIVDVSQ